MWIFVSGPYSGDAEQIEKNVLAANEAGKQLLQKGHLSFVPHTMMKGWQGSEGISWEDVGRRRLGMDGEVRWFPVLGPITWFEFRTQAGKKT